MNRDQEIAQTQQRLDREPALEGRAARLHRRGRLSPARHAAHRAHAGPPRRREALEAAQGGAVRQLRWAR